MTQPNLSEEDLAIACSVFDSLTGTMAEDARFTQVEIIVSKALALSRSKGCDGGGGEGVIEPGATSAAQSLCQPESLEATAGAESPGGGSLFAKYGTERVLRIARERQLSELGRSAHAEILTAYYDGFVARCVREPWEDMYDWAAGVAKKRADDWIADRSAELSSEVPPIGSAGEAEVSRSAPDEPPPPALQVKGEDHDL